MALLKQALEVMKMKIISHYGKSFRTSSKTISYMKYEEDSTKETHFGFETVKESEKAEKGMNNRIVLPQVTELSGVVHLSCSSLIYAEFTTS